MNTVTCQQGLKVITLFLPHFVGRTGTVDHRTQGICFIIPFDKPGYYPVDQSLFPGRIRGPQLNNDIGDDFSGIRQEIDKMPEHLIIRCTIPGDFFRPQKRYFRTGSQGSYNGL